MGAPYMICDDPEGFQALADRNKATILTPCTLPPTVCPCEYHTELREGPLQSWEDGQ